MSRISRTVVEYTCDHCGKKVANEPSQVFQVNTGGDGRDCGSYDRIIVQSQFDYAYSFNDSTLCDDCKWKIVRKFLDIHDKALGEDA